VYKRQNNRFIKSAYLNHAINVAFENLIAKESYPTYILFLDIDPNQLDINVHPTKQEIKFEDEKIIYAFVQAAIRHALAQFSISPSLDFTLNASIQNLDAISKPFTQEQKDRTSNSNLYQGFTERNKAHYIESNKEKQELKHWQSFFNPATKIDTEPIATNTFSFEKEGRKPNISEDVQGYLQVQNTYIIATKPTSILLVNQQLAHERVLYEKLSLITASRKSTSQKILFPLTIELSSADAALLTELLPDLLQIGFEVEPFGSNSFIIQGTPADVTINNEKHSIELLIEQVKHFSSDLKYSNREKIIRSLARQQAIKSGRTLTQVEMKTLVDDLFTCNTNNITASGNPTYVEFKEEYLYKLFERLG
jgi:DNA mismatch repair protein MutL